MSWFPHPAEPHLGNFIAQHISTIAQASDSKILHALPANKNRQEFTSHLGIPLLRVHFIKQVPLVSLHQALEAGMKALKQRGFEADLIHLHVCYPAGVALLRSKTPFVLTEHFSGYLPERPHRFKLWEQVLIKRILRKAAVVCPVSKDLGKALRQYGAQGKQMVVSNVVQDQYFHFQAPPPRPFRFLHISTLNEGVKNISGLCKVMGALAQERDDFEWAVGGDGNLKFLKEQLQAVHFPPERLQILGTMSPETVARQMQQSHAFVLFSWVENQPVVLLEALACGRPVISSAVGGIAEFINAENGLLVPSGDTLGFKQALEQMMDQYAVFDPPAISAQCLSWSSRESVQKKYLEVYASALPVKPSGH